MAIRTKKVFKTFAAVLTTSLMLIVVKRVGLNGLQPTGSAKLPLREMDITVHEKKKALQHYLSLVPDELKVKELVIKDNGPAIRFSNHSSYGTEEALLSERVKRITSSLCNSSDLRYWPKCSGDTSRLEFCSTSLLDKLSSSPPKLKAGIFDDVRFFLHFLGHPRSGSSIVGALLDAHPRALVCSSEYYLIHRLETQTSFHNSRENIYEVMAMFQMRTGARCRSGVVSRKGYSTCVEGMGVYEDKVKVVGDKLASQTVSLYMANRTEFGRVLGKLQNITGAKMKFVEVVRNPYDNIATRLIYQVGNADLRYKLLVEGEGILNASAYDVNCVFQRHFNQELALTEMVEQYNLDLHRVHLSDLIDQPREEMKKLCAFLHIKCSEDYLKLCEGAVFKESSKSRHKVQWTQEQINTVHSLIQQFPYLRRYSFTSG